MKNLDFEIVIKHNNDSWLPLTDDDGAPRTFYSAHGAACEILEILRRQKGTDIEYFAVRDSKRNRIVITPSQMPELFDLSKKNSSIDPEKLAV